MQMDKKTETLRVVIKDLGPLARREDILNQNIGVLVDSPDAIAKVAMNKREIENKLRVSAQLMRGDTTFDNEYKQIASQSVRSREVGYFKFYLQEDSDPDVFILNQEEVIFTISLRKIQAVKEGREIVNKGLVLKYQKAFSILIVSSEVFSRVESKELGGPQADDRPKDGNEMEDEEDNDVQKRKIARRKNPFFNKITERDKMNFQQYHQDRITNVLVNYMLMNNASGAKVIEGIIRQANELYMRSGTDFEKNQNTKKLWGEKLEMFRDACTRLLAYKEHEAERNDAAEQNGGQNRQSQNQNQPPRQGQFSFNEYTIEDVKFFIDEVEDRINFVLPHTELNRRLFLALSTSFVYDLFRFLPRKVVSTHAAKGEDLDQPAGTAEDTDAIHPPHGLRQNHAAHFHLLLLPHVRLTGTSLRNQDTQCIAWVYPRYDQRRFGRLYQDHLDERPDPQTLFQHRLEHGAFTDNGSRRRERRRR